MRIYFSGLNQKRELRQNSIKNETIEFCFEALNLLVKAGFEVAVVELVVGDTIMLLPIEAIDGEPLEEQLQVLQRELKEILLLK